MKAGSPHHRSVVGLMCPPKERPFKPKTSVGAIGYCKHEQLYVDVVVVVVVVQNCSIPAFVFKYHIVTTLCVL